MSDIAIKVENLSKAYQLGDFSTGTLSRDLERWWALMRGKDDPFVKIGEINDREIKGTSDVVWSLKDINFEIKQGDAVGIIGRNGAGKSTLLKILSRVTSPTTGSIKVKGRIASLLEVGTGFHPELTGRENIYLNGAILGMRKKEIARRFDEIVDFSGVERYVDTPVKRYSSGMYVRLAFAVAAYLESEILIVDEVLAVGDAEFQKKCLGKMNEVSKGEGRTVLFVSHNMAAIQNLCNKTILLKNGNVVLSDTTTIVLDAYIKSMRESFNYEANINLSNFSIGRIGNRDAFFDKVELIDDRGIHKAVYKFYEDFSLRVSIFAVKDIVNCIIGIGILNSREEFIFATNHYDTLKNTGLEKGENIFECRFTPNFLIPDDYYLNLSISLQDYSTVLDYLPKISIFKIDEIIDESQYAMKTLLDTRPGYIKPIFNWTKL